MEASSKTVETPSRAIRAVAACFVNHVFTFGPIYTFGIFLPHIKESLDLSLAAASSANSTMIALQFAGSLIAGFLIPHVVRHPTVVVGGAVAVLVGLTAVSFVETASLLYFASALAGIGLGACNLAGLTALNAQVDPSQRALLVGFATCGTSVGTVMIPPILSWLIDYVGWRWAMRIYAIASTVALVCTAPAFRSPSPTTTSNQNAVSPSAKVAKCRFPCRDPRFLCWWLNMSFCFLGYFAPAIMLAEFATTHLRLNSHDAAIAYTAMGVGALCTRICLGPINKILGGPFRVFAITQAAAGLMTLLLPWCARDLISLVAWSAAYGLCIGPLIAVISVVLSEIFGAQQLPLYHGCSRTGVGLGTICGPPLIGWLVEAAGYHTAFGAAGALVLSSQFLLGLLFVLDRRRRCLAAAENAADSNITVAPSSPKPENDGLNQSFDQPRVCDV
eukprot:TRINITY_DN20959_c0_g1_i1.p1 TRINITY_DN20959_c0_g1~~TRINITY_DN20959_c0_g1_i1.p1  ORF type:complete len:447 (+),score=40.36 TRINITY_DN20959_c0_g1_i1:32-1372(+)